MRALHHTHYVAIHTSPGSGAITPLTPPLCVCLPSRPRAVLICGTRRGLSSCVPSATLHGNGTCARASLRFLLLALLDDLVLAIGGGNTGGAVSSGVASIGVGSTHSSSSRSAESDEIVREKSTAVALREIVPPPPIVGAELGVTGPTGSSSVPPPLWPLSDAARKENWSPTAPSPASKIQSPLPPRLRVWTRPNRLRPRPNPYRLACHLPRRDHKSIRGYRLRPTTTTARQR